jgi:hypothetical protein
MAWIKYKENPEDLIVELNFHKSRGAKFTIGIIGFMMLAFISQSIFTYPFLALIFGAIFIALIIVALLPNKTILIKSKNKHEFLIKYKSIITKKQIMKNEIPVVAIQKMYSMKDTFDLFLVFNDEKIMPYSKGSATVEAPNTGGMFYREEIDKIVKFLELKSNKY